MNTLKVPSIRQGMIKIEDFRELTKKVILAEKYGFWSDWTDEQRTLYTAKNWEAFSRSRGYTEEEISDFREWVKMVEIHGLEVIRDLTSEAAIKNIEKDKNGEILRSSHLPEFRKKILHVENEIRKLPGALIGDTFPLKHTFADGMYIREISVPKGYFVITKIHKLAHPCFILKGDCSIATEDGIKRIKAPYHMITPAGTKRIVYVHEDTVWVTVHKSDSKDLEKIEEEIIAKSFDEMDNVIDTEIVNFITEVKQGEQL